MLQVPFSDEQCAALQALADARKELEEREAEYTVIKKAWAEAGGDFDEDSPEVVALSEHREALSKSRAHVFSLQNNPVLQSALLKQAAQKLSDSGYVEAAMEIGEALLSALEEKPKLLLLMGRAEDLLNAHEAQRLWKMREALKAQGFSEAWAEEYLLRAPRGGLGSDLGPVLAKALEVVRQGPMYGIPSL